jgi:hypothetical protein
MIQFSESSISNFDSKSFEVGGANGFAFIDATSLSSTQERIHGFSSPDAIRVMPETEKAALHVSTVDLQSQRLDQIQHERQC